MKLAICSDLHLEMGTVTLTNTDHADVLILSGDICVAADLLYVTSSDNSKSDMYHEFFQDVCSEFKTVIYIMGNHEHYHGDIVNTYNILKDRLSYLDNLHIVENNTVKVDDITFICGTLWSDMNNEDPITMYSIGRMMNDFRVIKNSNNMVKIKYDDNLTPGKFTPADAVVRHKDTLQYIDNELTKNPAGKFVVVGHHAPSRRSTHPRYISDHEMNGGYSSNLDFFIEDRPQIVCWTHGHTHEPFDYMISSTRIVCNPRGYINYEQRADDFELKFIEI